MARYRPCAYSQGVFIPIHCEKQILPGTFEYTLNYLIENELDGDGDKFSRFHPDISGLTRNWKQLMAILKIPSYKNEAGDMKLRFFNGLVNIKQVRHAILRLGRIKLVLIITIIAVILAITSDTLIAKILHHGFYLFEDLLRAALIPLLIAPFISWYLVGLLYELDRLEQEMALLARYDDLTGLLNRRAFYDSCNALHNYSVRKKINYSVLSVDLDHFKKINDEFGHATGDKVLRSFGEISTNLSRDSDIVARLGGEEFVFFLPGTNVLQAKEFSQRLYEKIQSTEIMADNRRIEYTISTGIATNICNEDVALEVILRHSDEALYMAKKNGRNQVIIYKN